MKKSSHLGAFFYFSYFKEKKHILYQPNKQEEIMETYLFIALIFVYILTAFMLPQIALKRIWTVAYIVSFIITGISIFYIKLYATDTLMKVGELNWYYVLYVFGSITIILGVILLWMYKKPLISLFTNNDDDDDNETN